MHELSIAQNILDIVNEQLLANNLSKAIKISIKIGKLVAVEPEALKFCFEIITRNTKAEGSSLQVDYTPIKCMCNDCQNAYISDELNSTCPKCMGSNRKVISGNELKIMWLEAE